MDDRSHVGEGACPPGAYNPLLSIEWSGDEGHNVQIAGRSSRSTSISQLWILNQQPQLYHETFIQAHVPWLMRELWSFATRPTPWRPGCSGGRRGAQAHWRSPQRRPLHARPNFPTVNCFLHLPYMFHASAHARNPAPSAVYTAAEIPAEIRNPETVQPHAKTG